MNTCAKLSRVRVDRMCTVSEKVKTTIKKAVVSTATTGYAKADLKKELRRLTQEYKRAQRAFKHNKISRQELFDFEWRIFELQEEIRQIEEDDLI